MNLTVRLSFGIAILTCALIAGGAFAIWRRSASSVPAVRTFALVAAGSIALLHLIPEAVSGAGLVVLLAVALGVFVPDWLERIFSRHHGHAHHDHDAPITELAMGYAAVLTHQLGEGAAVATMARAGDLTISVVLAIAAHSAPLGMVVSIRALEMKRNVEHGAKRASAVALAGLALATIVGSWVGTLVDHERIERAEPWILAVVAGLLLHALSHDLFGGERATTRVGRTVDAFAGLIALGLAVVGCVGEEWLAKVPLGVQVTLVSALSGLILLRSFSEKRPTQSPVAPPPGV